MRLLKLLVKHFFFSVQNTIGYFMSIQNKYVVEANTYSQNQWWNM